MTATVYEFPQQWYAFGQSRFRLQSRSQSAARPWIGGKSVYGPHAQLWVCELSMTPQEDPERQEIAAFFSRLDGQAGIVRISDVSRLRPWYDRNLAATSERFSDNSIFTDGTAFEAGYLPPDVYVYAAADRGDNYIQLAGFPASVANAMRRGDIFQIKPNGIPGTVPHLYEAQFTSATDASGRVGLEIRPRLRAGVAAGDQVSLRYPSTVFRLVDDDQGAFTITPPVRGDMGFALIEALDLAV